MSAKLKWHESAERKRMVYSEEAKNKLREVGLKNKNNLIYQRKFFSGIKMLEHVALKTQAVLDAGYKIK